MAQPSFPEQTQAWMERALALAHCGEALTSPNPMVGAVVIGKGRVAGEGFHTYDGVRHAEIVALQEAGGAARGSTLYVTLEPCCHTGRSGPCTSAIIAAGVKKVVAAMPDPNPEVAGRGFRELRAASIEVAVLPPGAPLREQSEQLNEAFCRWITTRRPFVTLKSAMTLDGQLALPAAARGTRAKTGRKRMPRWITARESRTEVQRMRHASDALLTGIGTVMADDPLLTDRTGLPRRRRLLRVVLDSKLQIGTDSQLVRSAQGDLLVFTGASISSKRARMLRQAGVEIIQTDGQINLRDVLAELGRRNILSVLLEAGATLNEGALAAGIVNKVRLFYAPILTSARPRHKTPEPVLRASEHALTRMSIKRFGPDFAVEGYLGDMSEG